VMGQTYYIKEINTAPAGRYTFHSFTGMSADAEGYYSFAAAENWVITARNVLGDGGLCLTIVKNLVDGSGRPYADRRDREFVFEITGGGKTFYQVVTVRAGETTASVTVTGMAANTAYTVRELDREWRYTVVSSDTQIVNIEAESKSATFTNKRDDEKWVDDKVKVVNTMPRPQIS